MTLQAQRVNIAPIEKACVWRPVWGMAKGASFCLDRRMLVDERTGNLGMTFHTNSIAGNTAVQRLLLKRAVRVMTVTAVHQSFIDSVMKGLGEERFYISVAAIAELWLRYLE